MKPVWIKYYGIIPMTKWGYLIALLCAGCAALLIVLVAVAAGVMPPLSSMWRPDPEMARLGWGGWMWNHMYWILIVCLVAQAIDTYCVLRTFAKKEQEQRRELAIQYEEERGGADIPPQPNTHVRSAPPRYPPPDDHVR